MTKKGSRENRWARCCSVKMLLMRSAYFSPPLQMFLLKAEQMKRYEREKVGVPYSPQQSIVAVILHKSPTAMGSRSIASTRPENKAGNMS